MGERSFFPEGSSTLERIALIASLQQQFGPRAAIGSPAFTQQALQPPRGGGGIAGIASALAKRRQSKDKDALEKALLSLRSQKATIDLQEALRGQQGRESALGRIQEQAQSIQPEQPAAPTGFQSGANIADTFGGPSREESTQAIEELTPEQETRKQQLFQAMERVAAGEDLGSVFATLGREEVAQLFATGGDSAIATQRLVQQAITEGDLATAGKLLQTEGGAVSALFEKLPADLRARVASKLLRQKRAVSSMNSTDIDDAIAGEFRNSLQLERERGILAAMQKPLSEGTQATLRDLSKNQQIIGDLRDVTNTFTREELSRFIGIWGLKRFGAEVKQLVEADSRFAELDSLLNAGRSIAFGVAGKNLTKIEADIMFGYIPTGREVTVENFLAKLTLAEKHTPFLVSEVERIASLTIGGLRESIRERESREKNRKRLRSGPRIFTTPSGKRVIIE